jgi:tetratricopeptide (TPR) repeat protein
MTNRSGFLVFGFLVLIVAVLVGCGSRWIAGGKLHFDQERYDRALETFEAAVAEQPDNGEAHLWLGRALAELERDEEASAEIRKGAELDPLQGEMSHNTLASYWSKRYNSGLGYAKGGADANAIGEEAEAAEQLGLAVDRFERAIIFCPDSVQNYSNLGKVLYQLGREAEAMEMFDRAQDMGGDRPDLQEFLYRVYSSLGSHALRLDTRAGYERALELFGKAAVFSRPPDEMADLYFNMGAAYAALSDICSAEEKPGFLQSAEEYYLKVLGINATDPDVLRNLAYVYTDQSDAKKALEMGQRLLDLEPWNPDYYFVMVRLYNAAGEREKSTGYMMLQASLKRDQPASKADIRKRSSGYGPGNDMLTTLRERGEPEVLYIYSASRGDYDIWCYWVEGRIFIFKEGREVFRVPFTGMAPGKVKEVFGGGQ